MAAVLSLLAVVALGALIAWKLGSVILRGGGLLLCVAGLVGIATGTIGAGVLAFVLGAVAWMAGHWLYAYRHHEYKSPLVRRLYLQLLPSRLDPTRGWGVPIVPAQPPDSRGQ